MNERTQMTLKSDVDDASDSEGGSLGAKKKTRLFSRLSLTELSAEYNGGK